jgi:hypothetical protein
MKNYLRRIAVSFAAVLSLIALGVAGVSAQTTNKVANGFQISPVRSEFTIEKSKSQTLTISIQNPTDVAPIAKPIVNNFIASDDQSGEPRLILDDTSQQPKNNFKNLVGSIPDVPLGPKEKKDVNVNITVPADASSGGYYGAIRWVPAAASNTGNVGLTASVGTIILVTVPGNLHEQLDLEQLTTAQGGNAKAFFTKGEVQLITELKNSGDIHVKPFGKVTIKKTFGGQVAEFEFNNTDPKANVLPGSTRKFVNTIPKEAQKFGRYTVTINLGYSQGSGQLITSSTTYWYMPPAYLIGFAVIVVLIVGAILWTVRKYRSRRKHKHDVNKQ